MSYRPICDTWLLARSKTKYYGAFPSGFLSRAMDLLSVNPRGDVLHVCSGKIEQYPFKGYKHGEHKTVDIDPALKPDFVVNIADGIPLNGGKLWDAILADPPYSKDDATHYMCGAEVYPEPNKLLKDCIDGVNIGSKVGFLHYIVPRCPKNAKFIACVGVVVGFGNRIRVYSVFERIS